MLAPSAARTVSLTDCMRFWALPTSISVASWSSSEPELPKPIFNNLIRNRKIVYIYLGHPAW